MDRLPSDIIPNAEQLLVINETIISEEEQRDIIESEVRTLRAREEDQTSDGDLKISLNKALLAPIRVLTIEVSQIIFEDVVESALFWTVNPLLLVSHVCSRWRRIASSSPILWKITIDHRFHQSGA